MEQEKPTGLNLITSTLNRGSMSDQVKALQQYLNGLGYDVGKIDSTYGPKVETAVKQYQLDNGLTSDGIFGSKSLAKAKTMASTNISAGAPGSRRNIHDPNYVPKTHAELMAYIKAQNEAAAAHPVFSGNSPEAIAYASSTGDFNNLLNPDGKPFSQADQEAALEKSRAALAPGFEATKSYDTQKEEDTLAGKNLDYERGLATDKTNFETDKNTLDENAASKGVLFSGGRYQREKKLQDAYQSKSDYARSGAASVMGGLARDYQYKYGNDAAKAPSLSQYYQLGGNSYNANVARGGVTRTPLSQIYNPDNSNFQGTAVNANRAAGQVRAAALLANKGNKLLASGYNNQL